MKFKFLEHTADIKFQAFGKTIEEVFENSAMAMKKAICGRMKVRETISKKIEIEARDNESLLYKFLEEILYMLDAENFLLSKIKDIKIKDFELNATVSGDSAKRYKFTNSVKAVTYNEMFVKQEGKKGKWTSQAVLDV